MSLFIVMATLLTLAVVVWMVRPLRRPALPVSVSSEGLNIAIYKEQLQNLERDLANGTISVAEHGATQDELQLRLLDDTEAVPPQAVHASFWSASRMTFVFALLFPLGAAGLYAVLGTPAAINPVVAPKMDAEQVTKMVEALAARLKANPDNPLGWAMLARSYKVMGRLGESEQAFIKAGALIDTEPDLLVDYADLLAVLAKGFEGRPLVLLNKALALNPQHPTGLMLSGVAAYRRADFAAAVAQWQKLRAVLPPGSPDIEQVDVNIADARAKAGMPAVPSAEASKLPPIDPAAAAGMTPEKINQMVERLAARLKANPDDPVGWARLARAYRVQGRLAEADMADARAKGELTPTAPKPKP